MVIDAHIEGRHVVLAPNLCHPSPSVLVREGQRDTATDSFSIISSYSEGCATDVPPRSFFPRKFGLQINNVIEPYFFPPKNEIIDDSKPVSGAGVAIARALRGEFTEFAWDAENDGGITFANDGS